MKQVRNARLVFSFGLAGAFALAVALGPASGTRAGAQAAPPPPPLPGPTAAPSVFATALPSGAALPTVAPTPEASATPSGRRGRRHRGATPESSASPSTTSAPEPTATPTSPAFATLDGTWEVQLQYIDHTDYAYLDVTQNSGGTLIGTWRAPNGKSYPFEGTYDGRLIRMTAKQPANSIVFSGYVEGAQDMVGLVDFGAGAKDQTPFTAEHRGGVPAPKSARAPHRHRGSSPSPQPTT